MTEIIGALPRVDELDLPVIPVVPANGADRLAVFAAARAKSWIAKAPHGYTVLRYEDVMAIHRDKRFVNGINALLRRSGISDERFLARRPNPFLRSEGEEHSRLRRLVTPVFSSRGADKLRPAMREELKAFADSVRQAGRADLCDCFNFFPISVICSLLDVPREEWPLFLDWTNRIFEVYGNRAGARIDDIIEAQHEVEDYTARLIEKRRKQPGEDLLSELISIEEGGDRLSTEEMLSVVESLLLAGTDTTKNQLGITFATLLQRPGDIERLRQDPTLIPSAVEESLRFLATSGGQSRLVHEDTEYKGVIFPADTILFTNFVSANFDPVIWGQDADQFDISRTKQGSGHLTFGIGRHVCIGRFIANAELEEALRVLLAELPGLRLDGEMAAKDGSDGTGMWGFDSIPVAFDPN